MMYNYNAKDCEQCNTDSVCCYCKNIACYQLEEQLKRKEQEYEELKSVRDMWMSKCEQEMKTSEFWQDRFDELTRTLIEIKKIAEKAKKDICNNCGWKNTDSCDPEDYTCGEFIKILQKISEAINE